VKRCFGNSTDWASNMQSQYKGFSALLSEKFPTQIHLCYSHILNVVLSDTPQCVLTSGSLFPLMNNFAIFFRESDQRMNIWEKESKDPRGSRLDAAVTKVFGSFGKPDGALYVGPLSHSGWRGHQCHGTSQCTGTHQPASEVRDSTYSSDLPVNSPGHITKCTSKYLQTSGLDILAAHQTVAAAEAELKDVNREFQSVKTAADKLIQWANNPLQE